MTKIKSNIYINSGNTSDKTNIFEIINYYLGFLA